MKHLIKYHDGSVAIMTMASDDINILDEIGKFDAEHQSKIHSTRVIDAAEVPEDRYFRDAWIFSNDKIDVDLEKSKDIHRDVLRGLRKPKLEALDLEFMKAVEQFDDEEQSLIRIKKQELRDITQHPGIVDAKSPDEVKSFMPDSLK